MHRDLLLDREIVRLNKQHKRKRENHDISLNLIKEEMLKYQEAQWAPDGEISELKEIVQTLIGQVKGKGMASDPTPQASGAGGRNAPPQLGGRATGAPGGGGDSNDDGKESGRKPDDNRKGRRDERPATQSETTMTPRMPNSLTSFPAPWPTRWDNE